MTRYLAPLVSEEKVSVKEAVVCHHKDVIHHFLISQVLQALLGLHYGFEFLNFAQFII